MKHIGSARGLSIIATATLAAAAVPLCTTPAQAAATRTLVATSADGLAFDLDEHDPGDVTVQVTGRVKAVDVDDAQDLRFSWVVTPFDTTAAPVRLPATGQDVVTDDVLGEFVVPFPVGQAPGTYVLVAGLGADSAGAGAIKKQTLLTLTAGNAEVAFADEGPLQRAAGAEHALAGALLLEDGTPLPGRQVDLTFQRGSTGSDLGPDAGIVALPGDAPVVSSVATTGLDGAFGVVLGDPQEDGQGTELGGTLEAVTAATPDIGDAGATDSLAVDLVSEVAPAGSTLAVSDLGAARPGESLPGHALVTAPDDTFDTDPGTPGVQGDAGTGPDPVRDQVYTLTVDHGFFTTGAEELPSVPGDEAGNMVDLGQTLTGLTDADGRVDLAVGMERDPGLDDDGKLAATVTALAGDLTQQSVADWSTKNPLNGHVVIALSPDGEQVGPVDPTLAGNRAYYEVFTQDQFGNRVDDHPVDLTYKGDLDDWDYSDDFTLTDYDTAGDIWLTSFETADIDVTGQWNNAPTYLYTGPGGNAVSSVADVTGTSTARFYELDFEASEFDLRSTATDVVAIGDLVTETVSVVDQEGNPVRGYKVQFYRYGPDVTSGDPVARRSTNGQGEATYSFIAPESGRARITAVVTDGSGSRVLKDVVDIGLPVTATLDAVGSDGKRDELKVKAPTRAAGAAVRLYRVVDGERTAVGGTAVRLDKTGQAGFVVADRNGRRATTYVAEVRSTSTTAPDTTNTARTR